MQRKNLCAGITAFIGLISTLAHAQPAATVKHKSSEIGLSQIILEGVTYDKISLPNTILTMEPGEPQLPVQLVYLVIPQDRKVDGVNIVSAVPEDLPGTYNIYPAQPALPIGGEVPSFTAPDHKIYAASSPYPGKLVEITGDGYMAGYHIVSLKVYPVQYIPAEGKLVFYNNIEFALKTVAGQNGSVPQARRIEKAAKIYEKMVNKLVANPADVKLVSPAFKVEGVKKSKSGVTAPPFKISSLPSEQSSPVEYLIITSEALRPQFERLAAWKTKKGELAAVRTVEWINQNYSGADGAEKMRNFVKDAYQYWGTLWVLLAGDINQVPYRVAAGLPCDEYFMGLEGNWNANGDDIYGSPNSATYYMLSEFCSVDFPSQPSGYALRGDGIMYHTSNGGAIWSKSAVPPMKGMDFADAQFGLGLSNDEISIWHTTNGGTDWQSFNNIIPNSEGTIKAVAAGANGTGWAAGYIFSESSAWIPYLKAFKTEDYGVTWENKLTEEITGCNSFAVTLSDNENVWVAGESKICHSTDGGNTWDIKSFTGPITCIVFINSQCGWASGTFGVMRTTDGGQTWNPTSACPPAPVKKVEFIDAERGWALASDGFYGFNILYKTVDGGDHWDPVSIPALTDFYGFTDFDFPDADHGYMVGFNGLLMQTENGGSSWTIITNSTSTEGDDEPDMYPEVFVSRAPVEDVDDAGIWIDKLLKYEGCDNILPDDYQNRMLFIGADMDEGTHSGEAKDMIEANYVQPFPQFNGNIKKMYPYYPYALNRTEVISALNDGYGIVNHSDHSGPYGMGTGINTGGGTLYRNDVDNLANTARPSVIYSIGCDAAAFDKDCMAEHFLTSPGGAVAFVGNSREGWYFVERPGQGPSDLYDQQYFKTLLPDAFTQLGTSHSMAKLSLVGAIGTGSWDLMRHCQYNLNAFGDPEMPIWTNNPQMLVVEHPASVTIGQNTVTVTVLDNNYIPVEGALVCLQKGYEAYAIGYPDAIGQVIFDYTPETVGEFSITVTAQNYKPYQGVCTVLPTVGGYICYDNAQIDDDNENLTQGNSDGILNPGETANMWLTVKNTGGGFEIIANVSLSTIDQYITPKTFSTTAHKINSGQSQTCIAPYAFTISPDCPDQHNIVFHMTANSCSDSFVIKVMADSLAQTGHKVQALIGNQYKITDLQITNFGSGAVDGATATLTTDDPNITIDIGERIIGAIAADGIATAPEGFTLTTAVPLADAIFTLTIKDRFDRQWVQKNFRVVPPAWPCDLTAAANAGGVVLNWSPVNDAVGYHVYRADQSGGPYIRLNKHAVLQVGSYNDLTALINTQYYYIVTALDASCNESGYSIEVSLYNTLGHKNGWPVIAGSRERDNWSSVVTGDINGDGRKEVILGANDGNLYVYSHDGTKAPGDWPKGNFNAIYPYNVSTALGDIDKCGLPEIIAAVGNATGYMLYIYKGDGSELAHYPVYTEKETNIETVMSTISIGDVDRNGWLNIILLSRVTNTIWNFEWNSAAAQINCLWHYDATTGIPVNLAVGDINEDDYLEIVLGMQSINGICVLNYLGDMLWQQSFGGGSCSSPSIGDVNNDGKNEITIAFTYKINDYTGGGDCFLLDGSNGDKLAQWATEGMVTGSLALGNIDPNVNGLEIVAGRKYVYDDNGLIAWHGNGGAVTGWPKNTGYVVSSPVIYDVNGDGKMEIYDGGQNRNIITGYKHDGQELEGFPIPTTDNTYSSPLVADLDGNGSAELCIDMNDGKIHAWEIPGMADPTPDWPMCRHDAMNSGNFGWLNEFSGHITRDLTLRGDNFFNGDVVIDPGVTVTLKPNARMYLTPYSSVKNLGTDPRCEIVVKGTLIANGSVGDSVRFMPWTALPTAGNWYGIKVEAGGNAQLDYCIIENAVIGLQSAGSSPKISNSRIQGCNTGIYCSASTAQIKNNLIVDNKPPAMFGKGVFKASSDTFAGKSVDSTVFIGTGIEAINSNLTLENNVIRNNFIGYYGGGSIQGIITNNTFEDNEYQGMDLYGDGFNMTITGNNFYRNAVPLNGTNGWEWAGISIGYREISTASSIIIEGNTFTENHAGARCTRYGSEAIAAGFSLIMRDNNFTTGNEVGLKIATDVSPNLTAIATGNYFTGSTIYGVYVNAVNGCPLSLGDLGNASLTDNGGNRIYNNGIFDLYYAVPTPIAMKAEGNFWNKKLASQIDTRIYDDNENSAYGSVDFQPFYIWDWPEEDVIWSGIVSVAGDIVVPADGTLKIEPGTIVRFISNFDAAAGGNDPAKTELIIYGQLELKGKPGELPVIFQSDAYKPQAGDWGGIIFSQPTWASKACPELDRRGSESKHALSSAEGGIIARDMKNCIVRHAGCGISIAGNQKLELKQCKLEQNTTGLGFYDQATAECKDDTITNNNTGIACNGYSTPLIKNSYISQNKNNGVVINDNAQPNVGGDEECGHNIIASNLPYNLYNATSNNIMAKKNYWGTMNVDTIAKYIFDGNDQSGLGLVGYLPLWDGPKDTHHGGTQLEAGSIALPTTFSLLQNAPNPMAGFTTINFAVAKPGNVSLKIYNISGQVVKTLINENKQQGHYNVRWDGKDESGQQTAAGVYFYRIASGEFNNTKKMVVLK